MMLTSAKRAVAGMTVEIRGHLARLFRAWAAAMLVAYLPALYWADPGGVPAWYLCLMALGAALPLSGPPAFLAAVVLIAARDRADHGARIAIICAAVTALLASLLVMSVYARLG